MANKTGIQWTDLTKNPATRCTRVKKENGQSGCDNCYAFAWHDRIYALYAKGKRPSAPAQYHTPFSANYVPKGETEAQGILTMPERLDDLLRLRKSQRVFLGSMTDLFHEDMPHDFLVDIWGAMAVTPHLTYQILTKRPERMREFIATVNQESIRLSGSQRMDAQSRATQNFLAKRLGKGWAWPLPNVWLGTSVEDQEAAEIRIPDLLQTLAAVHYLSCEPLLGWINRLKRLPGYIYTADVRPADDCLSRGIDWVIIGGESGPHARPMDLDWARGLVEQCRAAGTAVFVKQLGSCWARDVEWCRAHRDGHGGQMEAWPEDLRIREFPRERE